MVLIFSKVQDDAFEDLDIFNATGYNNHVITYITMASLTMSLSGR